MSTSALSSPEVRGRTKTAFDWPRLANLSLRLLSDALLLGLAYAGSFLIRFDGNVPASIWHVCIFTLPWVVGPKLVIYRYAGLFRSLWRYSGINELKRLMVAQGAGLLWTALVVTMSRPAIDGFPRGIFLIDAFLGLLLTGGLRFLPRWHGEAGRSASGLPLNGTSRHASKRLASARRVLIVGAGDAGEMMVREITRDPANGTTVVGFVDDDPCKQGREIHGIRVLGTCSEIPRLTEKHRIQEIVITIPSASGAEIRVILRSCRGVKARLRIAPSLGQITSGSRHVTDIRDLRIEDLLRRKEVELILEKWSGYLRDKRILVTGAGGSIGSELCIQIARFNPKQLLLFGRGENSIFSIAQKLSRLFPSIPLEQIIGDVINKRKLEGVFAAYRPEIVFHAGADKHVPLMETNPDEAVLNNVLGTRNVLEVCESFGVERLVCVSTDKVVNPTSVMGCCKRVAETVVRSRKWKTPSVVVRFGNVLGSRGSVVPTLYDQIRRGGPVTITHPAMTRFFMTIPEAAKLVIQAGALGRGGEVFVLDMGDPVKIEDLARDMIQLAGLDPDTGVPIQVVGIRPGEKLHEELVERTEELLPTDHPKILRINGNGSVPPGLELKLDQLFEAALAMDQARIRVLLSEIVSTYRPEVLSVHQVPTPVTKPGPRSVAHGTPALAGLSAGRVVR